MVIRKAVSSEVQICCLEQLGKKTHQGTNEMQMLMPGGCLCPGAVPGSWGSHPSCWGSSICPG